MVSEYGLSWCQLHGTQNFVFCAIFLGKFVCLWTKVYFRTVSVGCKLKWLKL